MQFLIVKRLRNDFGKVPPHHSRTCPSRGFLTTIVCLAFLAGSIVIVHETRGQEPPGQERASQEPTGAPNSTSTDAKRETSNAGQNTPKSKAEKKADKKTNKGVVKGAAEPSNVAQQSQTTEPKPPSENAPKKATERSATSNVSSSDADSSSDTGSSSDSGSSNKDQSKASQQGPVEKQGGPAKKLSKQELQYFETKIRPILVEKCYSCHSLDANMAEGGLRLDSREALLRGGSSGPAIVAGDPAKSLLVRAVEYRDSNLAMPPDEAGGKLNDAQIKELSRWIKMGAPDPREEAEHVRASLARNELVEQAKKWWAYQPITSPSAPAVSTSPNAEPSDSEWAWNDIDRFILAKQLEVGVQRTDDATPETLLRRLSFDLIGLPPSAEELQSFTEAIEAGTPRQQVIAATVDRLLDSDQYGVQWGRHWLDVARYGESTGREVNLPYNQAWRYRDWVIDAFRNNKPFDQFLIDQIAGDLLPAENDRQSAEQCIATGFLAIGSRNINENNPKQYAVDETDEQIDAVFQATMGTTLACARCHDHKFDPFTQKDYTAVAGIFLSTDTRFGASGGNNARNSADAIELPSNCGLPTLDLPYTADDIAKKRGELEKLREEISSIIESLESKRKQLKNNGVVDRSKQQELRKLGNQARELETQLSAIDDSGNVRHLAMGVQDKPKVAEKESEERIKKARYLGVQRRVAFPIIEDSPFFSRGDIGMPGAKIPRAVPNLFGNAKAHRIPNNTSGRLQLAKWITSEENPLTPRVAVNRIWYWMLGQGIVDSVDNFGTTGSKPTHPELLDYLSRQFVEDGWDVKAMIRRIATSRTYQLASSQTTDGAMEKDPENRLLWRAKSRRLQAEEIRDAMLHVAGRLDVNHHYGTTMAKKNLGNRIDVSLGRKRNKGEVVTDDICRSIYLPLPRASLPEVLELFDLPDGTVVQGSRESTNVPSQSLYLLNNQTVAGHAGAVVRKMTETIPGRGSENFDARVTYLYESILGRKPIGDEVILAEELFRKSESSEAAWVSMVRGLFATAEFRYLD